MAKKTETKKLIETLFDAGSFVEINEFAKSKEVICGKGLINGSPVYAFADNPAENSAAMGKEKANKLKKIYDLAYTTGLPIIGIYDSKGAHVNQINDTLNAYTDILVYVNKLSGVVPQISIVTGTAAGMNAVLAASADVLIVTEDSKTYITPSSLLNNGSEAGKAETVAKNGTASLVCSDDISAVKSARELISNLPTNNLSPAPIASPANSEELFNTRIIDRATFTELYEKWECGVKVGIGRISGTACGIVAVNSGDKFINSDASSKIARFVRFCDCFSLPIVSLIDLDGFERSETDELTDGIRNAARLAGAYSEATTVKIAVITGDACGAAYSIFVGSADYVFAYKNAVVGALAPDAAALVLMNDRIQNGESVEVLASEYANKIASAQIAAEEGFVNDIVVKNELYDKISSVLEMLEGKRVSTVARKHSNFAL